ncbi:HPr family phosphocarrier protein [Motiliproteus sp. MSK22-1]|uniref:HPr family phosphocarrier protein n=1 Tax=Motiliproteus sp. MSK22-1 TaxID=1897630 RepID=UPI0009754E86|nr:HPr family phosphocarrier protein [Motiliproteus sp. MSK22-1]OMH30369.1 phosphocarrier protein HPr [Motiliproteus sp. MSK22-1]
MIEKQLTIINKLGLHARATAKLISVTNNFTSSIELGKDGHVVNGKSIMSVMMLAASQGTVLDVIVNGEDEEAAINAVEAIVKDRFGESE